MTQKRSWNTSGVDKALVNQTKLAEIDTKKTRFFPQK